MVAKKKPTKSAKGKQQKQPFWVWRWTIETVYWLILLLLILAMGVWVMQLTMQTQSIYDKVQFINTTSEAVQSKKD